MKSIIINLMLFSVMSCFSQTITFIPLGIMDKPLPRIQINVSQNKNKLFKNKVIKDEKSKSLYVAFVELTAFNSIYHKTAKLNTEINFDSNEDYPFGTYRVLYKLNNLKLEYVLVSNKKSYNFFKKILPLTKSNEILNNEISLLLKRLI